MGLPSPAQSGPATSVSQFVDLDFVHDGSTFFFCPSPSQPSSWVPSSTILDTHLDSLVLDIARTPASHQKGGNCQLPKYRYLAGSKLSSLDHRSNAGLATRNATNILERQSGQGSSNTWRFVKRMAKALLSTNSCPNVWAHLDVLHVMRREGFTVDEKKHVLCILNS
jgi:hypothetical protein